MDSNTLINFLMKNKYIFLILIIIAFFFIIEKFFNKNKQPVLKVTQKQYDVFMQFNKLVDIYNEMIERENDVCDNAQTKAIDNQNKKALDDIQETMGRLTPINTRLSSLLKVMNEELEKNKLKSYKENEKSVNIYMKEIDKILNDIEEIGFTA